MNKYLLIGIIVVIAGLVIVTTLSRPLWIGIPLIGVWIYLLWMVWKKKTKIFRDQMEPKLAERHLKMMKVFLLVAGISLAVFVGMFLYGRIFGWPEWPEAVGFFTGAGAIWVFIIATSGSLVIYFKGRRKTAKGNIEIG